MQQISVAKGLILSATLVKEGLASGGGDALGICRNPQSVTAMNLSRVGIERLAFPSCTLSTGPFPAT